MLSTGHWMRLVGIIMKIVHAIEEMTLQKLMPFWMHSLEVCRQCLACLITTCQGFESRTLAEHGLRIPNWPPGQDAGLRLDQLPAYTGRYWWLEAS
mmetsp:Transcript_15178/g.28052  ORF Transcript_15178/g.28052 Transcript_15178/m.28052 type:complete len:96 (+) Transcript_15178:242-529(+)